MYAKVRMTIIQLLNFRGYRFLEYSLNKKINSFSFFYHRKTDMIIFSLKDYINIYLSLNK